MARHISKLMVALRGASEQRQVGLSGAPEIRVHDILDPAGRKNGEGARVCYDGSS